MKYIPTEEEIKKLEDACKKKKLECNLSKFPYFILNNSEEFQKIKS